MIFIYIFSFFIAFVLKFKKSGYSTSAFLLSIYLISSISAAIELYGYNKYEFTTISLPSVLFNLACLALFFAPIISFDNFDIRKVRFPNSGIMTIFAWVVIILCLSSLGNSFFNAIKVFSYSDLGQARMDANSGELVKENRIFLITYLGGYGTQLSLYALILYFYFKIYIPKNRYIQILLLISSLQVVIVNLAGVGRDGIVRWLLFSIFCFSLFRKVLTRKNYNQILINSALIFAPFIFIFIAISISRNQPGDENTFSFLIDYIGQPFINFSRFYADFQEPTFNGRLNFPFFFPISEAVPIRSLWVYKASGDLNVFPTFVGSFIMDFGAKNLLIFAFIYFVIAKISFMPQYKTGYYFNAKSYILRTVDPLYEQNDKVNNQLPPLLRKRPHFKNRYTLSKFASNFMELNHKEKKWKSISFTQLIMYCWLLQVYMLGIFYYMFTSPTCFRVFFILLFISYGMQIYSRHNYLRILESKKI